MDIMLILVTIFGLVLFEIITSIDNAIINAEVLSTMGERARKWFLFWGLIFAVFLVRGLLPWFMVWFSMPGLGIIDAFTATFSNDPKIIESVKKSSPVLLIGGGTFLVFLFLHWLFVEKKNFSLFFEPFFFAHKAWFFAFVSILLTLIVWFAMEKDKLMAFATVVGSTAFFITHGFKQNAEASEKELTTKKVSDISKILYLEAIDMTFSIDGVIGAFAFTLSVPLILIGNGIGAFVVRELTIGNIERIGKYIYLKNGAMYSVFVLGTIMILESFSFHIPSWISPLFTSIVVAYFFKRSRDNIKKQKA